jgi:triosephosphate isomerase (TIM)
MRKKIVAANWKMNLLPQQGAALIADVVSALPLLPDTHHVVFAVPYTHLHLAQLSLADCGSNISLAAQNYHAAEHGAYTGEISLSMLQAFNVRFVLVGHSERRLYNGENNELLKAKVDTALQHHMTPIFCCGESLAVREAGSHNAFVQQQLEESILHLEAENIQKLVIAYEPIWAIGTGVTASSQQAQDMHSYIRGVLVSKYGTEVAANISILYGGSCNATNAAELFSQPDIDGGLIGGAALKADTFLPIVQAIV